MAAVAAGIFMMTACGGNDGKPADADSAAVKADSPAVQVQTDSLASRPTDATMQDSTNKGAFSAVGVIGDVTPGKDGFMATLTSDKGVVYSTVFSIRALEKNYKKLNAGDRVQVSGDTMALGNKTHIVVKQFSMQ